MKINSRFYSVPIPALILLSVLIPHKGFAQLDLSGFIRNYNAVQTVPDHDILMGQNRIRFDIKKPLSSGEINISNDLQQYYNQSIDSLSYRLREAYAELYFPQSDLRVGKQIISWGRADGAFVTDILTPVDLTEFLTQDFSDLRSGITAISYTRYFGSNYLQLIFNPVFNPNDTPRPYSRWFPRTFFGGEIPIEFEDYERQPILKNLQFGGRIALRSNLSYDLDLGLLYWHYPNPSYAKSFLADSEDSGSIQLAETFTQSLIAFYSGALQLTSNLLLKSEAGYYSTRSFDYLTEELRDISYTNSSPREQVQIAQSFNNNSDGFLKRRPWLIGMAGLEYSLDSWTIGTQIIDEFIFNHDKQILQDQHFTYASLLVQRSFLRDKMEFRGFGRYNLNGEDFWVNSELTYSGIDNFEASLGTQLFGGPTPSRFYGHLSFNNYVRNSFAYIQITAYF